MHVGPPHSPSRTSGTIAGAPDNPDAFRVEIWPGGLLLLTGQRGSGVTGTMAERKPPGSPLGRDDYMSASPEIGGSHFCPGEPRETSDGITTACDTSGTEGDTSRHLRENRNGRSKAEPVMRWKTPTSSWLVSIFAVCLFAGGCASLSGRLDFHGFSVVPPEGGGWTADAWSERGVPVSFSKGPPAPSRPRTIVAMVTETYLALPTQDRTQVMQRLVESVEREQWGEARFKRIALETSEDRSLGADCIRYVATSEERGVPGQPVGSVFILEVRGLRCAHPSDPHLAVDISYSQRFPRGLRWDPAFDVEAEPFLRSLTFAPLPVSERRWEPELWQRMISAARRAKAEGNKAEAERLCVEVLQYVDTNVIRSLFDYAALLRTLKRDEAEAARARAVKVREARMGPGSVYLGWRPSDELVGYAVLLEELGRTAEAEAMRTLAAAENQAQFAHFQRMQEQRLQEQRLGGDPMGIC